MTRRYRPPHPRTPQYEPSGSAPSREAQLVAEANAAANALCARAARAVNGRMPTRFLLDEPWQIERNGTAFILVMRSRGGTAAPETAHQYGNGSLPSPGAARILMDEVRESGGVERWLREKLHLLRALNDLF